MGLIVPHVVAERLWYNRNLTFWNDRRLGGRAHMLGFTTLAWIIICDEMDKARRFSRTPGRSHQV
jgi:hypothetical protein